MRQFHSQNKSSTNSPIGGTPLYIIAGQSNCGRSRVSEMTSGESAIYASAISNAYMLNRYRNLFDSINDFEAFDAGANTMLKNAIELDEFGMEVGLARQLENYSSKARYYIKNASGNSDIPTWWLPPSGPLYLELLDLIDEGLNDTGIPGDIRLHAFIWMQGENDAVVPAYAANYLTNLEALFDAFRTEWVTNRGGNSDYKVIIGRIQDINAGDEELVRAAQEAFCADSTNNAILIDTDAYTRKDYIHFDATSQIQFGIDIFNQVKNL